MVDGAARVPFWGLVLASCARLAARGMRSRLTGLAHLAWDGSAGLALLIALLIAIGSLPGGFRGEVVRSVVAVLVASGAVAAWSDPVSRFARRQGAPTSHPGLMLVLALFTVAGLLWDRVPPVFFDARAYHFAFPELWLVAGRLKPESWSLLSWFPPGMSVLYGVGLATGGEAWANDANLLVGLCLIAVAADTARRLFGPPSAFLAALLTFATPLVVYAFAIPGADLGHGLFVFGALGALLFRSATEPSWLKRAGALAAGAVLTKYLGLIAPVAVGMAWLAFGPSVEAVGPHGRRRILRALAFGAPAVLLALPWLAANMVEVGNPVAPAMSSWFATRGLAPGAALAFTGDARGGLPHRDDLLRLRSRWFVGDDEESRIYPTPAWGWIPLALATFAVVHGRKERAFRRVAGLALALVGIWLLTFRWERFLVAVAAFVAVASAGGIVIAARRGSRWRLAPALAAIAAIVALGTSWSRIRRFDDGVPVALGRQSASEFVESALASVRIFRDANARLDRARDHVLLVGEMRHYGLRVPRTAPTGFNTHPLVDALRDDPDPDGVSRRLRLEGFTHLVVDPGWIRRSAAQYPSLAYLESHADLWGRYIGSLGAPLASEDGVALYRIPG